MNSSQKFRRVVSARDQREINLTELISINGLFTMIGESGAQVPVVKAGLVLWHKRRSEVGETV